MIRSRLTVRRDDTGWATELVEWTPSAAEPSRTTGHLDEPLPALAGLAEPPLELLANYLDTAPCPPEEAGAYLLSLLSRGGLADWLEQVRTGSPGPRSVQLDIQDASLRRVPWEMAFDADRVWAPFVETGNTWVRTSAQLRELDRLVPPVRLLFVAGRYEDVDLKADDELDGILRALCRHPDRFHVEYLVAPTRDEFDAAYDEVEPDILHVVAHGERSHGSPVLSLRDEEHDAWALTQSRVANGMTRWPRLVVLNACRSGTGREASEAAWGFTETFLDKGVGAVVTMQGDIPSAEGVAFTQRFYEELAAGSAVDVAAREGRRAVFKLNESGDVWSIPTVTLGAVPEAVLATPQPRQPPTRLQALAAQAVGWVDRAPERRRVWTRAVPDDPRNASRLIVVTGGDKTGKSAVVKAALPACHARGCDIAYVDFGPSSRLTWFAAVRRVHDDLRSWLPEHGAALDRFAHEAESLRTGPLVEENPLAPRGFGADLSFRNEEDTGDQRKGRIFEALRNLVGACAATNRLLLVLDHLATGLTDEARDQYLLPRLVQPLVDDVSTDLVVVTVVPDVDSLPLRDVSATATPVGMPEFEQRLFEVLLREYISRRLPDTSDLLDDDAKQFVRVLARRKEKWELRDLQAFGIAAMR